MAVNFWELGYNGDWIPMSADEAFEKKVAILGWPRTESRAFYEDVNAGDVIIVRRGSNYNVSVLYVGIAEKLHENDSKFEGCSYWTLKDVTKNLNSELETLIRENPAEFPGGNSSNPLGPSKSFCNLNNGSDFVQEMILLLDKWQREVKYMNYVNELRQQLEKSHNIVLHGAPGTGKTYTAKQIAMNMNSEGDSDKYYKLIQFHPSYDYTDFIEGLKPDSDGGNGFRYSKGHFKEICEKAIADQNHKYTLIIDEINRGDISRIFGEAFYAIDDGNRGEKNRIDTQYQVLTEEDDCFHTGFYVPENLYIIGTMNDIDRGVETMDFAIRRRFIWKELNVEESKRIIDSCGASEEVKQLAVVAMDKLNERVRDILGEAYCIGGSYFRHLKEETLEDIWKYRIESLLKEYLRGTEHNEDEFEDVKECFSAK